ncbi:MAG: FAD-binding protein [Bacteroidales bacterium]
MVREFDISLRPAEAANDTLFRKGVARLGGYAMDEISHITVLRRSVDARRFPVWIRMRVRVYTHQDKPEPPLISSEFRNVSAGRRVVIAGTGPAGLFAALRLIEGGMKPILLDRGKDVSERKRDIARLNREHKVNPDSNYCFGEGGAGTFSDGKLYTRSSKRGNVRGVLEMMVLHGASPDILVDTHPHIGSDRLLPMITGIRQTILNHGGEIHFGRRVTEIVTKSGLVTAFRDQYGDAHEGDAFILATGHSARDIYRLFNNNGWPLEGKTFALGVRVEHPQALINAIQYHAKKPDPLLPPASYALTAQSGGHGVFSFCMCPGGLIVPSATEQNQVVVNGMSNSRRNSPFANAGIVTEIKGDDLAAYRKHGSLAGIVFQEDVEQAMRIGGELSQKVPAQRLPDFLRKSYSVNLPDSSYKPGMQSAALHDILPPHIVARLSDGFLQFEKKMRGFITGDAIITATESRTSSPVRIPRDSSSMEYVALGNLYPCGEGAGYAGGIVSSAMDGENTARVILSKYKLS